MGGKVNMFGKKNRKAQATQTKADKSSKTHQHRVRHDKKGLLESMKIVASVPETIDETLKGDSDVLQSHNDYIVNEPVQYDGHDQYPVIVLDDQSLEDAGLTKWHNREFKGLLSRGLKVSTGDTGFVPIATEESLANGYIGLVPMHDAFQVLSEIKPINDYSRGWLAGLVYVDDRNIIHFSVTDRRFSLPDWMSFIDRKTHFVVNAQGNLILTEDTRQDSDPVQATPDEMAGGAKADGYSLDELTEDKAGSSISHSVDEFLDDPNTTVDDLSEGANETSSQTPTTNNSADQAAGQGQAKTADSTANSDDGVSLDDIDSMMNEESVDSADNLPEKNQQSTTATNTNEPNKPATMSNQQSAAPQKAAATTTSSAASDTKSTSASSIGGNDKAKIVNMTSQDQLDAQTLTVSSSQREASDLHVTVSPDSFIHDYVDSLKFTRFEYEDDHGDPDSAAAYLNRLRKHFNEAGEQAVNRAKSDIRAQISSGVNSLLSSLVDRLVGNSKDGSVYTKKLNDYSSKLSDIKALQNEAKENTKTARQKLENDFNAEKSVRKEELLNQLEREFRAKRPELAAEQQELIDREVSVLQGKIGSDIEATRREQHEAAQQIASNSYTQLSGAFQDAYQQALSYITSVHKYAEEQLNAAAEQQHAKELRRLSQKSAVIAHDTKLAEANKEIKQWQDRFNDKVNEMTLAHQKELDQISKDNQKEIKDAVAKEAEKTEKAIQERDEARAERDQAAKEHAKEMDDARNNAKLVAEDLRATNHDLQEQNDKLRHSSLISNAVRNLVSGAFGAAAGVAICLAIVGLHGGNSANANNNGSQSKQPNQTIVYTNPQSSSSQKKYESSEQSSANSQSSKPTQPADSSTTSTSTANDTYRNYYSNSNSNYR